MTGETGRSLPQGRSARKSPGIYGREGAELGGQPRPSLPQPERRGESTKGAVRNESEAPPSGRWRDAEGDIRAKLSNW